MSAEANKAVFRAHFEAIEERRLDTLDAHPGVADHKPFFEHMQAAFPDGSATLHEDIAEGDWVAFMLLQRCTHRGDFMGIPATGRYAE